MKENTRTHRTLQNSRMSLLLFLFQIFVGFYSRKVFLDYLGTEVLGVNTTLGNILSFLNLSELGIGIAMATSLYKPIQEKDHETICEILSVQGILYKRIAIILCCLSIPILVYMPYIFPSTECDIKYIYLAYIIFLGGSIAGYLWNYRQILLGADQKNYKLMPWIHGVRYTKITFQILFLTVIDFGIWGWILMEFISDIAMVFVINWILRKEYPWLYTVAIPVKELLNKYHWLIIKTRQIFIHKIGLFVLEQTAPLIIYSLVSLNMVTYYANYMVLIGYTTTLMNVIFEGMGASIGSLVAENNKKHTLEVFWELFTSRIWISAIACFALYNYMNPFITLWIGDQYILDETSLLLMIAIMFLRITRTVTDSFNHAYQLFGDIWSPVAEAIINLGTSFWLGSIWGLNGILTGILISLLATGLFWKPYYLFSRGLKYPTIAYYFQYAIHIVILIGCSLSSIYIFKGIKITDSEIGNIWISQTLVFVVFILSSFAILFITTSSMRRFCKRIYGIIHAK